MKPSSRSRSGTTSGGDWGVIKGSSRAADAGSRPLRDQAGRFIKAGSLVEASGPVQIQLDSTVDNEVSRSESDGSSSSTSPADSDFEVEEDGRSVGQQGLCSSRLAVGGKPVAHQVFVELPHSDQGAAGVILGGDSYVRVLEKGVGSVLKAPGSVEQQGLCSTQVEVVGGLVAQKVFDVLPNSDPVSAGGILGGDSAGRVLEKGVGSEKKAPWVNLFKDNRNLGNGTKLHEVVVEGDLIQLDEEDVDEAVGICLVGLFTGKFPGGAAVQSLRDRWKVDCQHWIHRSGWIMFEFLSEVDRLKVLNGGPYFVYGSNLMLKIMPRYFRFGSEEMTSVPTWIQLPDLPFDCWTERALSKIVSKIGVPITTDKLTRQIGRISFARVLVEVDVSKELITSVKVKLPTGVVYDQLVVFESPPKYCKKCKTFSHGDVGCNKESGGRSYPVYVPKRKVQPGGVDIRPLGGKLKVGEASVVKKGNGVDLAVSGQPRPSGSGTKGDRHAVEPIVGVQAAGAVGATLVASSVQTESHSGACRPAQGSSILQPPNVGLETVPSKGKSTGYNSGQASAALLPSLAGLTANPASPLCPAVELVTSAVGLAGAASKGKQKLMSGQQGAAAVLQHPEVVVTRLVQVCPEAGMGEGEEVWSSVSKKRKQKKKSGQPPLVDFCHRSHVEGLQFEGAAVQIRSDGESLRSEPVDVPSSWQDRQHHTKGGKVWEDVVGLSHCAGSTAGRVEECEAGRHATSTSVPKGKKKGKAPQSSK